MKKTATILLAVLCSTEAIAQNRIGEVTGSVVDSKGNPVADVTVQAVYAAGPVFGAAPEAKPTKTGSSHFAMFTWATIICLP
jgi:hypothetical protein